MSSPYVNPIPKGATPERIDMGVDYGGTGNLLALGNGVVTQVNPGGWGQYGNYIEYQLADGPQKGRYIYYAEGVTPQVKVGQKLSAGQIVASMIPGWHSGIEVGYSSGRTNTAYASSAYAAAGDGSRTAAGQAFSDLVKSLGGPPGVASSAPLVGSAPTGAGPVAGGASSSSSSSGGAGPDLNPADAITGFFSGILKAILADAKYAALTAILIIGGFVLLGKGINRTTHAQAPE
ncbi:MAG: hypothetical protein DLM64_05155 [Solirubrobacterales bacterium]|nr:MAG: hypothetical protein DLM64_05155 [Solirubrobacterales bacterium]